jgi:hypothetical protein
MLKKVPLVLDFYAKFSYNYQLIDALHFYGVFIPPTAEILWQQIDKEGQFNISVGYFYPGV